jgi:hypothetical protein
MNENELREELKIRFMSMGVRCHGFLNRTESDEHTVTNILRAYRVSLLEDLDFLNKTLEIDEFEGLEIE